MLKLVRIAMLSDFKYGVTKRRKDFKVGEKMTIL